MQRILARVFLDIPEMSGYNVTLLSYKNIDKNWKEAREIEAFTGNPRL